MRRFTRSDQEGRCYCVYDTGEPKNPAHAEIFQQVAGIKKPMRDDRRQKLFEKVKARFVPVAEYRGGLLAYLAPPNMMGG